MAVQLFRHHRPGNLHEVPTGRKLQITGDEEADALLTSSPLALMIGMLLDQQIPLEWAFKGPATLQSRLGGSLDAASIAAMDPGELSSLFSEKPAIHRYPGSMATRTQALCSALLESYGGDPSAVWSTAADGLELRSRLVALPGFGEQKARIFIALLGKQRGLQLAGWREACTPYGDAGSYRSVADIVDGASLQQVRETKAAMKQAAKAARAGT